MAKPGRVGLGLWDRLVLLLAWGVTCGLVYLLGFYVGKGTQARSLRVEQQVVRLPVTSAPPPEGQRPKTEPEFGFYDKLMGEQGAERAPDKVHEETKPVAPAAPVPPRLAVTAAPALASKHRANQLSTCLRLVPSRSSYFFAGNSPRLAASIARATSSRVSSSTFGSRLYSCGDLAARCA